MARANKEVNSPGQPTPHRKKKGKYNNLQNMVVQNLRASKGNSMGPVGSGTGSNFDAGIYKGASDQGVFGMPSRECTENDLNLVYRHQ